MRYEKIATDQRCFSTQVKDSEFGAKMKDVNVRTLTIPHHDSTKKAFYQQNIEISWFGHVLVKKSFAFLI